MQELKMNLRGWYAIKDLKGIGLNDKKVKENRKVKMLLYVKFTVQCRLHSKIN